MKNKFFADWGLRVLIVAIFATRLSIHAADSPWIPKTKVSIEGQGWRINGEATYRCAAAEGLLLNVRMVNATFEDTKRPDIDAEKIAKRFIEKIPAYRDAGVRAFSLCLQGGEPGYEGARNSAFQPDGSLDDKYLARVREVIRACDASGVVVILGCYYQRQDQILANDDALRAGVRHVARWIAREGFTNVVLEVANEFPHKGFNHAMLRSPAGEVELVRLAKATNPKLLVSTSGIGNGKLPDEVAEASDFLLIHYNGVPIDQAAARIRALKRFNKPIVCNEDQKIGEDAARILELSVREGASWGYMHLKHNQRFPFHFDGPADDPVMYAAMKKLTTPQGPPGAAAAPGKTWETAKPSEVGLNESKLRSFQEFVGGDGCVARRGMLATTWGNAAKPYDVASACKPWYTHFLLVAIEEGLVPSVDSPVVDVEPRLAGLNPSLNHKDKGITWRHLACQTSCYGVSEPPGKAYDYSDFNMALFFDTLTEKVYRTPRELVDEKILAARLTRILDCEDKPTFMGARPGRLKISCRDFARLGVLYLRRGDWNGRRVLDADRVAFALSQPVGAEIPRTKNKRSEMIDGQRSIGGGSNQTEHYGSYSFAWWINGVDRHGGRMWPSAPVDTFAALGHAGKRALVIIPSRDLVVVWNNTEIATREAVDEALKRLLASDETASNGTP